MPLLATTDLRKGDIMLKIADDSLVAKIISRGQYHMPQFSNIGFLPSR